MAAISCWPPNTLETKARGRGPASAPFTLADEAARTIALIDECEGKIHLVGHSYGGGVALHVALARPERIASMALYEPSAFHLLRQMSGGGVEAFAEITSIVRRTCEGIVTGDYRGAASAFVDYWNGPGAWDALRPAVQEALIRWSPKAPLDFRALIEEPTPASAYRTLDFPVLILRGEHAPLPTRVIAEGLSHLLPASRLLTVDGAGHMGPLTHAPEVVRARSCGTSSTPPRRAAAALAPRSLANPARYRAAHGAGQCHDLHHPPLSGAPHRRGARWPTAAASPSARHCRRT